MLNPTPYAWLSQYFFGFFFSYGVYLPFWALWFNDQGMAATDIGLLIGIGLATRCFSNLVITPRLHKVEQLVPALRVLTIGAMLFIVAHFFAKESFWLMALVTVLFNLSFGPITPLSDAIANHYDRLKMLDYGRTRLWGSIAFISGSTVVGYLVSLYNSDFILYTALAGMLFSILMVMRQPNPRPVTTGNEKVIRPKLSRVLRDWSVIKFLIALSLIQGSHAAYYAFSSIYWQDAGYTTDIIGYLWSLGVASEIAVFALSNRVFGGLSIRSLFVIAAIGVVVRWGLTASTTVLPALILIQMLHGITFALGHFAAIRYIQESGQRNIVVLQALYNAIPMGLVMAGMTTISGWGYEAGGAAVFWAMAAMGVMTLFIKVTPPSQSTESVD